MATRKKLTPAEWKMEFDERAAIAEYDGNQPRKKAEDVAKECVMKLWIKECTNDSRNNHG